MPAEHRDIPGPPSELVRARHRDPYPYFAWLRTHAPVFAEDKPNGLRVWQVTRYDDVRALLADDRLSKRPDRTAAALGLAVTAYADGPGGLYRHLLHTDPPEHTRLRALCNHAFTPRRIAGLAPAITAQARQLATRLDDRLASEGTVDLITGFAYPLAYSTICTILGVPPHLRLQRFGQLAAATLAPSYLASDNAGQSLDELHSYLAELIRYKRDHGSLGDHDLLAVLLAARDRNDALTEQELICTTYLLMTVGHDTTMNLIGNGTLALLRHPDQLDRLRSTPSLMPSAIEELLRYDCPARKATFRVAAAPIELHGQYIPRGGIVSLAIGAANRDPAQFPDPDRLDITRSPNDHLAFGRGPHFCIGAALSRMEAASAFEQLLDLDLSLAVDPDDLQRRPSQVMNGLTALPVTRAAHRLAAAVDQA